MSGPADQHQAASSNRARREEPEVSSAARNVSFGFRRAHIEQFQRTPPPPNRSGIGSTPTGHWQGYSRLSRSQASRIHQSRGAPSGFHRPRDPHSDRSGPSQTFSDRQVSAIRRLIREGGATTGQPLAEPNQGQLNQIVPYLAQVGDAPAPQAGQATIPLFNLPRILQDMKSLGCYPFTGKEDPQAARAWLKILLRAADDMRCAAHERVTIASRLLEGPALSWWEGLLARNSNNLTWDKFLEEFDKQYHAEYYVEIKRQEFVGLRQGPRTVNEYEIAFRELSEYALDLVTTEKQMCKRFEQGLKLDIRDRVNPSKEPDFQNLLEQAYRAEQLVNARQRRMERQRGKRPAELDLTQPDKRARVTGASSSYVARPGKIPDTRSAPPPGGSTPPSSFSGGGYRGFKPFCVACRTHHAGYCRGSMRCFRCNETGHLRAKCPHRQTGDHQPSQSGRMGPNQRTSFQRNTQGRSRNTTGNQGGPSTQHPGSRSRNQVAALDRAAAQVNPNDGTGTL